MAARSISEPRLMADTTPMVTPMMSQMKAAPATRISVRGARSMSSSRTESRVSKENPRPGQPYSSPVTRFERKIQYCWYQGLSRPSCSRTIAMFSSVGTRPAKRSAGSPGGQQVEDHERHERDDDDHQDRPEDAPDDVRPHSGHLSLLRRRFTLWAGELPRVRGSSPIVFASLTALPRPRPRGRTRSYLRTDRTPTVSRSGP